MIANPIGRIGEQGAQQGRTMLGKGFATVLLLALVASVGPAFAEQSHCEVYGAAPAPESSVPDGSTCVWFVGGPACEDPSKVGPATNDWPMQDDDEIERLGCAVLPSTALWLRVVRCDPSAMASPNWGLLRQSFPHPIRGDSTLPRAVCELDWTSIDGRSVVFYANYFWIIPLK